MRSEIAPVLSRRFDTSPSFLRSTAIHCAACTPRLRSSTASSPVRALAAGESHDGEPQWLWPDDDSVVSDDVGNLWPAKGGDRCRRVDVAPWMRYVVDEKLEVCPAVPAGIGLSAVANNRPLRVGNHGTDSYAVVTCNGHDRRTPVVTDAEVEMMLFKKGRKFYRRPECFRL